ncbi:MAG: putative Ig domain-containing protein, partial [Pseudobdellovibrio sp.]
MKIGTYVRLLLILLFCGACSRNPLGEDLKQPILNLSFTLTQSCTNTFNQDVPYSCQIVTSDVVSQVVFSLDTTRTTCKWLSLNAATGLVTGTPDDDHVGICQVFVNASNQYRTAPTYTYSINVQNVAPTLTIANAPDMMENDPVSL